MQVRYFAAARAAAGGTDSEELALPDGVRLGRLLDHVAALHAGGSPLLESVIARSSFLVNEVVVRDRDRPLTANDVVDILPPFAGG